ncbi:PDZ domain-containing protein [Yersinia enterocolitica]
MAQNLSQQLIEFGEVKRGQLGIRGSEMTADMAKAFNIDAQRGAFVSEVMPKSAASKAGIKAGDVLVSVDGKPISSFAELRAKVGTTGPGKAIKVGLLRDGKPLEVTVTLENSSPTSTSADTLSPSLQGASLSNGEIKGGSKGVKVENVTKGSPAAQSGLQKDDVIIAVNRVRVKDIAELRKAIEAKPAVIALNIVRGEENIYLLIR